MSSLLRPFDTLFLQAIPQNEMRMIQLIADATLLLKVRPRSQSSRDCARALRRSSIHENTPKHLLIV
jgi:hypothetical protein